MAPSHTPDHEQIWAAVTARYSGLARAAHAGQQITESGFETKAAALTWGRDQEARIREGRWTDPNAGKLTVGEWIDRWLAMQDVGISTVDQREYLIRRFIRPAWGTSPLHSLSTEEITRWDNGLPAQTGISQRTARAARTLLGTVLGDAAATKPPLIPTTPRCVPATGAAGPAVGSSAPRSEHGSPHLKPYSSPSEPQC